MFMCVYLQCAQQVPEESRQKASDTLELELLVVLKCLNGVLRTAFQAPERAASTVTIDPSL